jgi:alpha-1,2-mannosyltransferase
MSISRVIIITNASICVILAALAVYVILVYQIFNYDAATDLQHTYYAAKSFLLFDNPYMKVYNEIGTGNITVTQGSNLSASLLIYVISAISRLMSSAQVFLLWTALSLFSLLVGLYLSQKYILAISIKKNYLTHLAFLMLTVFTFYNVSLGQCGIVFFLGMAIFTIAYSRHLRLLAVLILAIMTGFKLFFLFFTILFLAKKEYFHLVLYLLLTVFFLLFPYWHNLMQIYQAYSLTTEHIQWYSVNGNASFFGFYSRLLGLPSMTEFSLFSFPVVSHYLSLASCGIYTVLAFLACRKSKDTLLSVGIIASTMLLVSPLGWIYYFLILYAPFLYLKHLAEAQRNSNVLTILLYVCLLLSAVIINVNYLNYSAFFLLFIGNMSFFALFIFVNLQLYLAFNSGSMENTELGRFKKVKGLIFIIVLVGNITSLGLGVYRYLPSAHSGAQIVEDKMKKENIVQVTDQSQLDAIDKIKT